ncbi:DUF6702 family protein [Ferrimonas aestuarii]|uniref:DUF2796 domain-containing protein n=1 Tax=Ferrimonas aestuarii TaxID=2569539 RepID=A0A4U1BN26_9GAMM|nr:DUF6702 family protein [Ferrimonas aestuarii]TKB53269.1 hypothetical protein FCL42_14445 [Ferrimonas aestuarii]
MKPLSLLTLSLLLSLWSSASSAHQYHFGMTDLSLSQDGERIEIVHRYSANDLARALNLQGAEDFSSAEGRLERYLNANFGLGCENATSLDWVGVEAEVRDVWIYQEVERSQLGSQLCVSNQVLMELEPSQVNTINLGGKLKTALKLTAPDSMQIRQGQGKIRL